MLNRLKEIREAQGLSQGDVARRIGTTAVSVGRYEKEPQRITLPILFSLARALGVTPVEIISGEKVNLGIYSVALKVRGTDRMMLFDRAFLAGTGEAEHLAVFEVTDDAMEPTLPHGGLCLVDTTQTTAERDGLYLIEARGHETVRRVFVQLNGDLRVAGDHPMYRDGMVTKADELKITGRVVWGGRRF